MSNEINKDHPMYIIGMSVGTVLIGVLFGIGYNLSLMLFS